MGRVYLSERAMGVAVEPPIYRELMKQREES